jgi:PAS domain S-box-containing protein/putative nucleotidyltransferase with HDIG domain
MSAELRILIVEDLSTDAELCAREIQKIFPHSVFRCVETREDYLAELASFQPDMILSDYKLPSFDGMMALKLALERVPETPFIIITGSMNEETAVDCMKAGAWDYVIKEHMKRLGTAVITALKRKETLQENRRSEEKRREGEILFRKLFEDHAAVKLIIDPDNGNVLDANMAATEYYGWSLERLKRMNISDINTLSPAEILQAMAKARSKKNVHFEFRHRRADGSIRDVELFSSGIKVGGKDVLHSIVHDITDRKRAEKSLSSSEAKYRAIFENAIEGIYQATIEGKYISVNPAFAKILGYGTPEELISSVTDIAGQVYVNPEERSKLIDRLSVSDLVEEFEFQAYRKDGTILWMLANARVVRDENGNIDYFEGRVQDITQKKRIEEKLKNTLDSLRRAVGTTIQVMMSAVGTRDPYTAGHQIRSAELARAIATEMGLPQDKIEGIRMAGIIHDIGKLSVPAEILSKAAKLTAVEFSFVKEHSWIGFEILKDVESPWPLAEIVYQHHERMDGSGYPRNLKGDEILMEARILAVTDVVESMASHRPYRPALGLDTALKEIEKNRGTLYDESAVDACLRLFREKGYKLKEP